MKFEFNDYTLRGLALLTAILGLALLQFVAVSNEPLRLETGQIDNSLLNKLVEVDGEVRWSKMVKGILLVELQNRKKFSAVMFKPAETDLEVLRRGKKVRLIGKPKKYEGKIELVIEKAVKIDE